MSGHDCRFEPTHVLVVTTSGDATVEATATAAAVRAVLDHADTVALRIDLDAIATDHPDLAHRLQDRTDRVDDELRARVDRVCGPLSDLLDVTDVHRFVTLERLDASRDGRQILHYVPDHAIFEIDASAADGVAEALDRAVTDLPAGLLPATTLADWDDDGTHYELDPSDVGAQRGSARDRQQTPRPEQTRSAPFRLGEPVRGRRGGVRDRRRGSRRRDDRTEPVVTK
jgi:hypothetical protein